MHAHQHVGLPGDLTPHECHVLDAVEQALEHVRGEVAVLGRDARLGHPPDQLLAVTTEADEIRDRDQLQPVLGGKRLELGQPGHRSVVVHDLGEHTGGRQARQARQVHGIFSGDELRLAGLGVEGPGVTRRVRHDHAAGLADVDLVVLAPGDDLGDVVADHAVVVTHRLPLQAVAVPERRLGDAGHDVDLGP